MEPSIRGRRSRHFGVSGNVSPRFARQKHFSCASRRTPRSRSRRFLRFGSRSVVTPGVRARGWGGTRTSSRTRPPSAEPPSWRPSCSSRGVRGVGGQWLEGGTPGKWPACRKKRRKRPGGTHLGPQRPASGAQAEKRDMLAMSVKLAGRGARVHVRRVSRARANARMRVGCHPSDIFRSNRFSAFRISLFTSRACFSNAPTLFRARGGRHGGPRPPRVWRVRRGRLRDPHGQNRSGAAVSDMHDRVRRRDGHAVRSLLLRDVHHVQHPAQEAVSPV